MKPFIIGVTGGSGSGKSAMLTGILIAAALAAGVLLGNYVFRLF